MTITPIHCRFEPVEHVYTTLDGVTIPNVTGMLWAGGHVDDEWFTDEGRHRGTVVHHLTKDYDLGALTDPRSIVDEAKDYLNYILAYIQACTRFPHTWTLIEEPRAVLVDGYRLSGTIDRGGTIYLADGVLELKTGAIEEHHAYQTALQTFLNTESKVPPEHQVRYALYLKANGKYKLEEHINTARDYREAERLIRRYGSAAA